jgi:prevent-host-death family protein
MKSVGTFEGKTHFSALVEQAEHGETIIITRKGRPVAQLGPLPASREQPSAEEAYRKLLALNRPLGANLRELIEEGRRG